MKIPFAEWKPDQSALLNPGVAGEALGVLPGPGSYLPWPSLTASSLALPTGACVGAFLARKEDGVYVLFAGTQTNLYKYVGVTDNWTDVTRLAGGDYSVPDDEYWSFDQFGQNLVAVNANSDVQYIDVDSGTNFDALAGSPPRARYVRTVGDQLMLAGLTDTPNAVRWSGRNDITYWTIGSRDSDIQEFPDGGFVTGIAPLEAGMIFQEGAIRKFGAVSNRAVFQFAKIQDNRGLVAPYSLVNMGAYSYFLSEDGFMEAGPEGVIEIGVDKIDKWFRNSIDYDRIFAVVGAADPIRQRIFWIAPTSANLTRYHDIIVCYDRTLKRWTHDEIEASFISQAATPGYTLESLDALGYTLDTLPFSLDSKFLQGGAPFLAAFDGNDMLGFFSGSNRAARVETADFQLIEGGRALLSSVSPLTDASSVTITVGKKARASDSFTYGGAVAIQTSGRSPQRANGRYHRIRADIPAAADWNHILGVEVSEYSASGTR